MKLNSLEDKILQRILKSVISFDDNTPEVLAHDIAEICEKEKFLSNSERCAFYRTIQQLEKENTNLKQQISKQKYLNYKEVDFILGELIETIVNLKLIDVARDKTIDKILALAIQPITKNKMIEKLNKIFNIENDKEGYYQIVFHTHIDSILTWEAAKDCLIEELADEILSSKQDKIL